MTLFNLRTIICIVAVFCWIRYLYKYSLKKPADRNLFFKSAARTIFFLPIGLQSLVLFCFALAEAIPTSKYFIDFFNINILGHEGYRLFDGTAIRIIFVGSLLVATQYVLMKINFFSKNYMNIIACGFIFMINIYLLKTLLINIDPAISFIAFKKPLIDYTNDYLWALSILLVICFAMIKGKWIYETKSHSLKYLSLTSRILLGYLLIVFLLALPIIICCFFEHK